MSSLVSGSARGNSTALQQDARQFAKRVREHLFEHLMPFWCGPALDHQNGGWMGWLSNDLTPDRTKPKGLIVNTRILWAFSAVHRARPDELFRKMADRAFDFVTQHFWDAQHGGAFWQLDDTGKVLDDSKKTYGQAFCIYALAEYSLAFSAPKAMSLAIELFCLIERHAHDDAHGGYLEVRRRDWSEAPADARLSDKDMNEKKSMNNHLHVLEAYTNLYRLAPSQQIGGRLRELVQLFEQRILDARTQHFHHFFNETWNVRSDTYTFGHDIEGIWLLCEAAEVLGDAAILASVRATALRMAETTLREAVEPDGGVNYEGKAGKIIDGGKECWPQAEAVIGFLNAFQISGDPKYFTAAQNTWNYIERHLVDRVHGEWFWRITPEGRVDTALPKVSEWKGPYHASRACLEAVHRLDAISSAKESH